MVSAEVQRRSRDGVTGRLLVGACRLRLTADGRPFLLLWLLVVGETDSRHPRPVKGADEMRNSNAIDLLERIIRASIF